MFRMNSRVFSILCEYVENAIGIDVFKSEYKQHIICNEKTQHQPLSFMAI